MTGRSGSHDILLAGATGGLGLRIARELRKRGAGVRAVVRRGTKVDQTAPLLAAGVVIIEVDLDDPGHVTRRARGWIASSPP